MMPIAKGASRNAKNIPTRRHAKRVALGGLPVLSLSLAALPHRYCGPTASCGVPSSETRTNVRATLPLWDFSGTTVSAFDVVHCQRCILQSQKHPHPPSRETRASGWATGCNCVCHSRSDFSKASKSKSMWSTSQGVLPSVT